MYYFDDFMGELPGEDPNDGFPYTIPEAKVRITHAIAFCQT
jgi:hypothetical protein